jgi:hypothetical protein
VKLVFFVKQECPACINAKEKIGFFLNKWEMTDSVAIELVDAGTEDGLIEAAMQGVGEIPTIILRNGEEELGRWEKKAPVSDVLMQLMGVDA